MIVGEGAKGRGPFGRLSFSQPTNKDYAPLPHAPSPNPLSFLAG